MNTNHLHEISATEVILLFQSRELSPVELMQAVIDRAGETETLINAFADQYFDEALDKAKTAEQKYANPKTSTAKLEGVPLVVKDDTAITGRRTTTGSLMRQDHIDDHTNPSIERLEQAGAIIHGRTNCPEFCWAWVCYSRLYGVTRNPWNPELTPGGSSGGSAASLAADSTILATGTDSAGSIRQPASLCGMVGFKPPYGRNPQDLFSAFDVYNHIGPMTKTVSDSALMQNVMSGHHPMDHCTVNQSITLPDKFSDLSNLKIAWSMDLDYYEVSEDVQKQTLETIHALEQAGGIVEQVDCRWAREAIDNSGHYGDMLNAAAFTDAVENHQNVLCDYTVHFAEQVRTVNQSKFQQSLLTAGQIWGQYFGPIMERYDAFICPTTTTNNIPAEMKPWDTVSVNSKPQDVGDTTLTILFNMFSRCPVLAVPSGKTTDDMPTGVQIIGKPFDDATVFQVGANLERIRPWRN